MWIPQKSVLSPLERISHEHQTLVLSPQVLTGNYIHSLALRLPDSRPLHTDNHHDAPEFLGPMQGRNTCFFHSAGHFVTWASKQHCLSPCENSCLSSLLQPSLHSVQTGPGRGNMLSSSVAPHICSQHLQAHLLPTPSPHAASSPWRWCQPTRSADAVRCCLPCRPSWDPCSGSAPHFAILLAS